MSKDATTIKSSPQFSDVLGLLGMNNFAGHSDMLLQQQTLGSLGGCNVTGGQQQQQLPNLIHSGLGSLLNNTRQASNADLEMLKNLTNLQVSQQHQHQQQQQHGAGALNQAVNPTLLAALLQSTLSQQQAQQALVNQLGPSMSPLGFPTSSMLESSRGMSHVHQNGLNKSVDQKTAPWQFAKANNFATMLSKQQQQQQHQMRQTSPIKTQRNQVATKREGGAPGIITNPSQLNADGPRRWTEDEDERLRRAVNKYGDRRWKEIAAVVVTRDNVQCLQRWRKSLKPGLIKGPWHEEEDALLRQKVKEKRAGPTRTWTWVASFIAGRNAKQCRERWQNFLDDSIKRGGWSEAEDNKLRRLHKTLNGSWAMIAREMPGRTENSVKVRFQSIERMKERVASRSHLAVPKKEGLQLVKTESVSPSAAMVFDHPPKMNPKVNKRKSSVADALAKKRKLTVPNLGTGTLEQLCGNAQHPMNTNPGNPGSANSGRYALSLLSQVAQQTTPNQHSKNQQFQKCSGQFPFVGNNGVYNQLGQQSESPQSAIRCEQK